MNFAELPERARTGKLVIEESSKNLLIIGLKHNEFDSYDPEEYDHNDPDYIDVSQNEIGEIKYSNASTKLKETFSAPENTAKSFKTSFDKFEKHSAFNNNRPRPFTKIQTEIKSGTSRQPKSIDPVSTRSIVQKGNNIKFNMRPEGIGNRGITHKNLAVQEWLRRGK